MRFGAPVKAETGALVGSSVAGSFEIGAEAGSGFRAAAAVAKTDGAGVAKGAGQTFCSVTVTQCRPLPFESHRCIFRTSMDDAMVSFSEIR